MLYFVCAACFLLLFGVHKLVIVKIFEDRLYSLCTNIINHGLEPHRFYKDDDITIRYQNGETKLRINNMLVYSTMAGWEEGMTAESKRSVMKLIDKLHYEAKATGELLPSDGNFTKAQLKQVHDSVNGRLRK